MPASEKRVTRRKLRDRSYSLTDWPHSGQYLPENLVSQFRQVCCSFRGTETGDLLPGRDRIGRDLGFVIGTGIYFLSVRKTPKIRKY